METADDGTAKVAGMEVLGDVGTWRTQLLSSGDALCHFRQWFWKDPWTDLDHIADLG